jgi:mono/diheme cytochrome c family protein
VLAVIKTKCCLTSNAGDYGLLPENAAAGSHFAGWGKDARPARRESLRRFRVIPRFAPIIGLLAGLAPAAAHAQTDIDQGKTPAQIFAADCAVCHKAARGLAKGKNSGTLAAFLREHYTTSREQAAALAAYVLKAPAEEPKPANQQARQPAKPEEATPPTAKLQQPADEEAKPDDKVAPEEPNPIVPGRRPAAGRNEHQPATTAAARGRRKQREAAPPAQTTAREPAAVLVEPGSTATPNSEMSPTPSAAAAPAEAVSGEAAPVPRDNIPD